MDYLTALILLETITVEMFTNS